MTKPAVKAATKPAKPMAKPVSPAEYLAKPMTDNQRMFLQFVLAETGVTFPAKEMKAFELGVKAAGLYARYQASKRDAKAAK